MIQRHFFFHISLFISFIHSSFCLLTLSLKILSTFSVDAQFLVKLIERIVLFLSRVRIISVIASSRISQFDKFNLFKLLLRLKPWHSSETPLSENPEFFDKSISSSTLLCLSSSESASPDIDLSWLLETSSFTRLLFCSRAEQSSMKQLSFR